MPRKPNKPFICENCDHICQHEKKTTTKDGEKINYIYVIHIDGIPRLGLEFDICEDCKEIK